MDDDEDKFVIHDDTPLARSFRASVCFDPDCPALHVISFDDRGKQLCSTTFMADQLAGMLAYLVKAKPEHTHGLDLSPLRERMVEAILAAHLERAKRAWPDPTTWNENEAAAENETYRPFAEADADAIIAAVGCQH